MGTNQKYPRLLAAAGALVLAGLACASPGGAPTATEPPSATPTEVAVVTAAPTEAPTAAATAPTGICQPPMPDASIADGASWQIYCDEVHGFAFRYPAGPAGNAPPYDSNTTNVFMPFTAGTNLTEKYIGVTVQEGASVCQSPNAAGYAPGSLPGSTVTFNGVDFDKVSGSDAGAGQFRDFTAYSTLQGELCVSMTFILHSVDPGNLPTPPPEFDKAAESAVFDQVMATFTFFQVGQAGQAEVVPTAEGSVVNSTDCNPPAASGPGADQLGAVYCNTQYRFGFRYAPVGDAGYPGTGPLPMPFTPSGDVSGKYLDISAQQDQIGCYSGWAEGIVPDEKNSQNLTINNIAFVKMEGVKKSATTGLFEHWTAYSTFGNSSGASVCLVMTFVIESGSETPTFDTAAETAIYPTMVGTIIWY